MPSTRERQSVVASDEFSSDRHVARHNSVVDSSCSVARLSAQTNAAKLAYTVDPPTTNVPIQADLTKCIKHGLPQNEPLRVLRPVRFGRK